MSETLISNSNISHYRIVSKLGAGGMGEVYLAQDTSELGRTVALKILPSEVAKNRDRLQRFTQEARTVSNLNHPNILTVYEFGQTDTTSFIASEYIDGITLREHVLSRRLKLVDVLDLTIQIVAALNAAHEAGVTHRDLKPENVMVRRDQIVKVLDFGLAKPSVNKPDRQIDSEAGTRVFVQTEPGIVMGTASYMSPEQSVGKDVDQRSDIWSVGVVLYEMLAGSVPFSGKDIHRQIIAIQESELPTLSQQVVGVPERLEEIVAKCLAKDRDERYQTAKDLLIDLRNLRRKLDVDAEIERTVAPEFRSTGGGARGSGKTNAAPGVAASTTTTLSDHRATSSAEYIAGQVKQHKIGAIIAAGVLALAVAATAYYVRARNTEVAIDSIAVLPFDNRSSESDTEYLSDGLAESLIYRFSQLPNLKVSPTSSVFRYKGKETDPIKIGNELGVNAVMSGRIVQRGDNLTISVELVDVRNNKLLWGEQYERKMSDLLATQREIATAITQKLQLKLAGDDAKGLTKRYTNNNEAYQLYLKGRFYWNKRTEESIRKAIQQFESATEKDPNFALAYAGLADCHSVLLYYTRKPVSEVIPQAKAYATRALEIDESLAEAHTSLGLINQYLWNWAEAEKEYKRAIELNANYPTARHWYSRYLRSVGRHDEALAQIKQAHDLDSLSLVIIDNLAENLMEHGDVNGAIEQCKRSIELDPTFWSARRTLASAYLKQGRKDEALVEARKAGELVNKASVSLSFLGHLLAASGHRDEAAAIIKELKERYAKQQADGRDIASVYAGLGEKDQVFVWLEKDFQSRNSSLVEFRLETAFEPIFNDRRFKELLGRMGLL